MMRTERQAPQARAQPREPHPLLAGLGIEVECWGEALTHVLKSAATLLTV